MDVPDSSSLQLLAWISSCASLLDCEALSYVFSSVPCSSPSRKNQPSSVILCQHTNKQTNKQTNKKSHVTNTTPTNNSGSLTKKDSGMLLH